MPNLPKIVVERLQSAGTESHPDADLLTAFAEQSLAGLERDHVFEHLARCGECREVVSIALPPQADLQPSPANTSNWFRWPVLRWAAVAAGGVLIASLGTLQYRAQHSKELASNAFDKRPAIITPARNPQGSSQPVLPQAQAQTDASVPRGYAVTKANPQMSDGSRQNPASRPAQQKTDSQAEPQEVTSLTSAPSQIQDQVPPNESAQLAQADRVAKAKPASPQAAPSTLAPPSLHIDPVVLKSLTVPRWIVGAAGTLQKSLDGGKTWLDVSPASPESTSTNFTSPANSETPSVIFRSLFVSSSAAEIWAGGSGGALYHTTDGGENWARVLPSASGISVTGDITSIQFSDPRHGTLATSTAEVWATADNGQTWRKQQ